MARRAAFWKSWAPSSPSKAGVLEADPDSVYVKQRDRIIWASGPIKARELGEAIAATLGQ
jgi:hypothetical protein